MTMSVFASTSPFAVAPHDLGGGLACLPVPTDDPVVIVRVAARTLRARLREGVVSSGRRHSHRPLPQKLLRLSRRGRHRLRHRRNRAAIDLATKRRGRSVGGLGLAGTLQRTRLRDEAQPALATRQNTLGEPRSARHTSHTVGSLALAGPRLSQATPGDESQTL